MKTMRNLLKDELPMEEWQRRRNQQLSGESGQTDRPTRVNLSDELPINVWQQVRDAEAEGGQFSTSEGKDFLVGGSRNDELWEKAAASYRPTLKPGQIGAAQQSDIQGALAAGREPLRYLPVLGSGQDALLDFADGRPIEGLADSALAASDAALGTFVGGVVRAVARKTALNTGKMTGNAVRKQMMRRGVTPKGWDLHHVFELDGIPRNVENWRNHPAFMKALVKSDHKRMHGRDLANGLPEFNALEKMVVGTPTWMKTLPGSIPRLVQVGTNAAQSVGKPRPPAPFGDRPLR